MPVTPQNRSNSPGCASGSVGTRITWTGRSGRAGAPAAHDVAQVLPAAEAGHLVGHTDPQRARGQHGADELVVRAGVAGLHPLLPLARDRDRPGAGGDHEPGVEPGQGGHEERGGLGAATRPAPPARSACRGWGLSRIQRGQPLQHALGADRGRRRGPAGPGPGPTSGCSTPSARRSSPGGAERALEGGGPGLAAADVQEQLSWTGRSPADPRDRPDPEANTGSGRAQSHIGAAVAGRCRR